MYVLPLLAGLSCASDASFRPPGGLAAPPRPRAGLSAEALCSSAKKQSWKQRVCCYLGSCPRGYVCVSELPLGVNALMRSGLPAVRLFPFGNGSQKKPLLTCGPCTFGSPKHTCVPCTLVASKHTFGHCTLVASQRTCVPCTLVARLT